MNDRTEQAYRQRMLRVLLYIEEHLDQALELERLARVAHFSPYHFHRVFTGFVGEPVKQYIRRLRLERAALQLKQRSPAITRIALDAGFESHEAFSRAFKKHFGMTPSDLRQSAGEDRAVVLHTEPIFTFAKGDYAMEVRIENTPAMRIAFVRHVGPYDQIGPVFERLCGWAGPLGLLGPDTQFMGIYHDDPDTTAAEKLRSDAAVSVNDGVEGSGEVQVGEIAAGDYAIATHVGPYSELKNAYRWLYGQWLASSGREPADAPCFERYLNNPETTPPEELVTEIYVPLKG